MLPDIKGFLETSFVDWPGKLCAVLFLPYCNFRCPYCHNHPLILRPGQYASIPFHQVLSRLRSLSGWIDGVCVTGGEPTLHPGLPHLLREIRKRGVWVKLDTNGSNPQMLEGLMAGKEIDFVSMDVKAPLNPFSYRRATGVAADLAPLMKSINLLTQGEVDYEFRMTVVPGLHGEDDIKVLGQQLKAGRRFFLQNFNPEDPLDPSLKGIRPFDLTRLKALEKEIQRGPESSGGAGEGDPVNRDDPIPTTAQAPRLHSRPLSEDGELNRGCSLEPGARGEVIG